VPVVTEGTAAVTIAGALEARMQEAALVIIPQMNEGHWPRHITPEPWLNRSMRVQVGLNFAERQVALAAHDLSGLLKAPQVVLTRALREADAPMVASRFWERLQLVLEPAQHSGLQARREAQREHYKTEAVQPPSPTPPLALRPKRFSATGMEELLANPFVFFVRHVCGLQEREALDAPFSNKEIGTLVHRTMEKAAVLYDGEDISRYTDHLTRAFEETLAAYVPAAQAQFYRKRLSRMLHGIVQTEAARAYCIVGLEAESKQEHVFAYQDEALTLHAKIDRLERRLDGALHIVDYKTGKPPTFTAVSKGKCQLVVAAMLMEALEGIPYAQMVLEYWEVRGAEQRDDIATRVDAWNGKQLNWNANVERVLEAAYAFAYDANVPFTWEGAGKDSATYPEHIARVGEW
jgi:ATP-dependent helicase/nuclease subunit B